MKKNYLKEISQDEKNFILEMHKKMGYNTLNEGYIFEDENQDVYNSLNNDSSAKNIARVIKDSNGGYLGNDNESWAEAAFNKIPDLKTYQGVTTILGQDVIMYLEDFMDINKTYYKNSIASHYDLIKQKTIRQSGYNSNSFLGREIEKIAKTYYKSSGKNIYVWQKLLKLSGKDLGNYGPNKDGIDGDWGTTSKNALKSITGSNSLNFENFKKLIGIVASDKNKAREFVTFVESSNSSDGKEKTKITTSELGFIIPFSFPTYTPTLENPKDLWDQFIGLIGRTVTSGGKDNTYGAWGHGGIGTVDAKGNVLMFEFGRYEGAKKGYGITRQKNVGVRAKIVDGIITNVNEVVKGIKNVTHPPGPSMEMDYLVLSAPNIVEGINYAKSFVKSKEKKYEISDFSVDDDDANCGTFAVEVARASGAVTSPYCFPTPNAMITQLGTLNNVIDKGTM